MLCPIVRASGFLSFAGAGVSLTGLPQIRKCSRIKEILRGQGKVREFYSESEKVEILKY